jgi:signal transduction histidine kinase
VARTVQVRQLFRIAGSFRWSEPAFGAGPIPAFPLITAIRWVLLSVFLLRWAAQQFPDPGLLPILGIAAVVTVVFACDLAFFFTRDNPRLLSRAWVADLILDVFVLNLAAVLDPPDGTVIALVPTATVFIASGMFRARFVLSLAVLAAALATGFDASYDIATGQDASPSSHLFTVAMLLGTGAFAAARGQAEERLRRSLFDSTEREHAQAAILRVALELARVSQARFHAFAEHAPAALTVYNRDGVCEFANRYVEQTLGRIDDGTAWGGRKLIAPDGYRRVQRAIMNAFQGITSTVEFGVVDPQGRPRQMSAVCFPMDDAAGIIALDVTDERALAARMNRAAQLQTAGTLAGGIAHDFNNLLTVIIGNVFLASKDLPLESDEAALLREATLAAERGADLVRRLLDYSRPQLDTTVLVSVASVVEAALALVRPGLHPAIDVRPGLPPPAATVHGNFSALQQVFVNLLLNARDAMPDGGFLVVRYEQALVTFPRQMGATQLQPGAYQVIIVEDSGVGIPDDVLPHVFDPFFTTKEVGKGTGLGLPTSLSTVVAHGGSIDVETNPGHGSCFRVMLPAAPDFACPRDKDSETARVAAAVQ